MLLWLLLLLSASVVKSQWNDLGEGDQCSVGGKSTGTCKFASDCPPIIAKLKAGINPSRDEHCAFVGDSELVCCTDATESTPAPGTEISDGRGAIANQKCSEYGEAVFVRVRLPVLLPTATYGNKSLCAIKTQKLIVGGTKAEPKEFPHMAAVGFNSKDGEIGWICGGTLISESFVMTAAHCTYSAEWGAAAWIRLGDLNLVSSDDDAEPQERRIVDTIRHKDYHKPSAYNDIALLRMDSPVTFTAYVRPACLYTQPSPNTKKAIAAGWGLIEFQGEPSDDLLKVIVPLITSDECNAKYQNHASVMDGIDPERMICAGENGKDSCQADSGGPLVIYGPEKSCMYNVIGVTSRGKFCGTNAPSIYTRVYHYIDWIESVVWPQH